MTGAERGFLLLSSCLGDPSRKPLTTAQMRVLAERSWQLEVNDPDRDLAADDLTKLGYGKDMAQRIVALLSQEDVLEHYLSRGKRAGCQSLTRISDGYPLILRKRLGLDSPGVLWAKGDLQLLKKPMIALVGSRDLHPDNQSFAREVGLQAAKQGYVLVSGNARGADKTAQDSCLAAGGQVICVVADELAQHRQQENILYLSEEDFDLGFSAQRALSRNRVIHALGCKTFVAQATLGMGGSWDGAVKNLRFGWSPVFCYADGSEAARQLTQMGANPVSRNDLSDLSSLTPDVTDLFDL